MTFLKALIVIKATIAKIVIETTVARSSAVYLSISYLKERGKALFTYAILSRYGIDFYLPTSSPCVHANDGENACVKSRAYVKS
jgi:hypothetical protein